MGALFHEEKTPHQGTYFSRPHQQWQTFNPFNQPLVHDITARAEAALKDAGTYHAHAPGHGNGMQWKHEFMLASFTASIELAVLKHSDELEYIFHDEICDRIGGSPRFKVGRDTLKPDRAFGIRYKKSGAVRIFLVEADRTTEPVTGSSYRKTYADNLRLYREFIGGLLYKDALKFQGGVVVLNLLTSPGHKVNVMRVLSEMTEGKGNNYMAFHVLPEYGYYFQPVPPMMQLLSAPYERVGRPPFFIDKE